MSKESARERLARLQRESQGGKREGQELLAQLTHQTDGKTDGKPDFAEIAKKLEERKAQEPKSENEGHVKMTIYVREDLHRSFAALCTKRGDQKVFINEAIEDFIVKKTREMDLQ